jgi:protein-disulfide isomerase
MKTISLLMLVIYLSGCAGGSSEKKVPEGTLLPSFNILLTDSNSKFNADSIPVGKPIVLFFFSPACPYCRAQTEEIVQNMPSFENAKIYIITNFPFPDLMKYYNRYQLKNYRNITVGQDYTSYFIHYFKPSGVPYMAVYTKNKQLKQTFTGRVSIDKIKSLILE